MESLFIDDIGDDSLNKLKLLAQIEKISLEQCIKKILVREFDFGDIEVEVTEP